MEEYSKIMDDLRKDIQDLRTSLSRAVKGQVITKTTFGSQNNNDKLKETAWTKTSTRKS